MITSFILALSGYALLALVALMDKAILNKSVKSPAAYAYYSTIFFLALFALLPFSSIFLTKIDWIWATFSGITFGLALWTSFIALDKGEASHISPFLGAVVAISTYVFSSFVLNEMLTNGQQIGLILIVLASCLLSFEQTRGKIKFNQGYLWAIASGILFGLSHVSAKYIYEIYPFFEGIIASKASVGIIGLFLLSFPSVRETLKKIGKTSNTPTSPTTIVVADKLLGIIAVLLIQYAIAIGSVTIINALAGVQYALVFIFAFLATKFIPKVFSEYFEKKEIIVQTLAILLIVIGSVFFVL
jgi:uncharacterized membrane protein